MYRLFVFMTCLLFSLSFADQVPTKYDSLVFSEGFESGLENWITKDFSDSKPMWHIDSYKALGDSGHAWWCGTSDSTLLASPPGYGKMWQQYLLHSFDLSLANPPIILSFYHLYDSETFQGPSGRVGADGGTVQVSDNNGETWQSVEPVGGYPFSYLDCMRLNHRKSIPGYSGKINSWEKAEFNLDAFRRKEILVRWYFASDFAVDDYDMPIDKLVFDFFEQNGEPPIPLYDSDGAWFIDNIEVKDANGVLFYDDVENGENQWKAEKEDYSAKEWVIDSESFAPVEGESFARCTNGPPVHPMVNNEDWCSLNGLAGIYSPKIDLNGMNKVYVSFWARHSEYGGNLSHFLYADNHGQMLPCNFHLINFDYGYEYDEANNLIYDTWFKRTFDITQFTRNDVARLLFIYGWINQEGMSGWAIDDVKVWASPRYQSDLAITEIYGTEVIKVGQKPQFNIRLVNAGTDTLQRKLIKWTQIIKNASGEIVHEYTGRKPIPANFAPDSSTIFTVSENNAWTSDEAGLFSVIATVEYPDEVNAKNDTLVKELSVVTGINKYEQKQLPATFQLYPNFPNPFNPQTQISYDVPEKSFIKVAVYNSLGQHVKTLVNSSQNPGHYEILWNGTDDNEKFMGTGLYFCRMEGEGFMSTIKLVLVK